MMKIKKYSLYIGSLAAAAALGACANGSDSSDGDLAAAPFIEKVRIVEKAGEAVGSDAADSALGYVAGKYDDIGGLSGGDDFLVKADKIGKDGKKHIRMTQSYDGIRIWGADIVVHASNTSFEAMAGNVLKNLDGFDTTPGIEVEKALDIAKSDYENQTKEASGDAFEYSRDSYELMIYPFENRDAKLVWYVQFFTELQNGLAPGLWNYFVDAKSGDIVDKFNSIHTLSQGSGPGGNAKVARTWTDELDVEEAGGGLFKMETARLVTTDMNNSQSGNGTVVTGPLNAVGDAAENDAHGFAEATLNFMQDWFGYNSIDDNGFVIRSRVHYGNQYENAFWDGSRMTYGDGRTTFYPLCGDMDVVAHEINHGFTTFHSDLTYSGQSGGINESFSDVAGIVVDFFLEGDNGDFLIGADIFRDPDPNKALRYACDPPQDGSSIGHADDYTSGMDVHHSSGVFNKAFCLATKRFASGDPDGNATAESVKRVGTAWYLANANFWNASTDFEQGCQGVLDAANSLGFTDAEKSMLEESFLDVGVACNGATPPINCDVTLTEENGTFASPNYPNDYPNNFRQTWCIRPASGQPATLTWTAFNTEANYDFVKIRDANSVELSNTSGTTAPPDATSTMIAVTFTSDGSVVRSGFEGSWSTGSTRNEPPVVSLDSPADGATVSGAVNIAASASDSDGTVASVTLSLPDGRSVELTSAPYELSWDSSSVADGSYTISAVATDNLGAQSPAVNVSVSVSNSVGCIDGTFSSADTPIAIPDNNSTGISSAIAISGSGNVASLAISLDITHTWRGDLIVTMTSPSGTQHTLHSRSGGSADDLIITDLALSNFNGESAAGSWQLNVSDRAGRDLGTLNAWSLRIVGDCGGGGGGDWAGSDNPDLALVDNGSACTSIAVSGSGDASDAIISLSGNHDWRSILRATLEHGGTTIEVFPTGTFPRQAGPFSISDQAIAGFSGDASGTWTLCIIDTDAYNDTGTLDSWSIHN